MASFRYRALSSVGTIVAGEMTAPSETAVIQQLRNLGHYPISTTDVVQRGWRRFLPVNVRPARRVSARDLSVATQELATLLRAGLELDRALSILKTLRHTQALHSTLERVLARIRDGESLADALVPEAVFSKLYVNIVRAGEAGGQLEATMARLADYLARGHAIRDTVTAALVYPIILLCTAGLSIIVILVFVLPQFESLFADAGKSLPLSTRIVMGAAHFLATFWWLLGLLAASAFYGYRRALDRPEFRARRDAFFLKLPLFGELIRKIETERFTRTLGTLLVNGVPLPTALSITKDTLSNSVMADAVKQAASGLREGEALADHLARTKAFPSMTVDLVRVGEESGKLDEMLLRQAELYERGVKLTVDRLLALLVPVLTIVLGLIVAGLIASVLVAILSVNELAL